MAIRGNNRGETSVTVELVYDKDIESVGPPRTYIPPKTPLIFSEMSPYFSLARDDLLSERVFLFSLRSITSLEDPFSFLSEIPDQGLGLDVED